MLSVLNTRLSAHYARRMGVESDGARLLLSHDGLGSIQGRSWEHLKHMHLAPKIGTPGSARDPMQVGLTRYTLERA